MDVQVLALCWDVEREVNGLRWLRDRPAEGAGEAALKAVIASGGREVVVGKKRRRRREAAAGDVEGGEQAADDDEADEASESEEDEEEDVASAAESAAVEARGEEVQTEAVQQQDWADADDGDGEWITPRQLPSAAPAVGLHVAPATAAAAERGSGAEQRRLRHHGLRHAGNTAASPSLFLSSSSPLCL